MNQYEQHLGLLSMFHYIVGGITVLFALFPVFHLIFGLVMLLAPTKFEAQDESAPMFIAWFFIIFAAIFIMIGWALAGCVIAVGRCLAKRRRYLFCLVMAGIECILMPFGTVLGVFTIIVLMRDSVKEIFTAKVLEDTQIKTADGLNIEGC